MKAIAIPVEVFNKLGEYLLSRPFGEVRHLIPSIEQAAKEVDLPESEDAQSLEGVNT